MIKISSFSIPLKIYYHLLMQYSPSYWIFGGCYSFNLLFNHFFVGFYILLTGYIEI